MCSELGPKWFWKITAAKLDSGMQDQEQSRIGETDVRDIPLDQLAGLYAL